MHAPAECGVVRRAMDRLSRARGSKSKAMGGGALGSASSVYCRLNPVRMRLNRSRRTGEMCERGEGSRVGVFALDKVGQILGRSRSLIRWALRGQEPTHRPWGGPNCDRRSTPISPSFNVYYLLSHTYLAFYGSASTSRGLI